MRYRPLGKSPLQVSELCLGTMMFADQTDLRRSAQHRRPRAGSTASTSSTPPMSTRPAARRRMVGELLKGSRARLGAGHQGRQQDVGAAERIALLARLGAARVRRQPAAAGHRPHRHLLPAPRLQRHGPRGAAARHRHAAARRQDPLLGGVELPRLAHRRDGAPGAHDEHARRRWSASPTTTCSTASPRSRCSTACAHHGIGVVPYSPIARGVLAGKYAPGSQPGAGTRAGRGDKRMLQTEFREESLQIAQTLKAHCDRQGCVAAALRHRLGAGQPARSAR